MWRFVALSTFAAINFALAFRTKISLQEDLKNDLKRDKWPWSSANDTLPAVTGRTPLTAKQRMTDRTSLGFVYGLLGMKSNNYVDTFCSRSKDDCATVDGFPGGNSHSELTFDVIVKELMETPKREEQGLIRRLGDLGYFIFNDLLWEKDWKTFPIGADFEDHHKHRPTADKLMGHNSKAWSRKLIRQHVDHFFKGRKSMKNADYGKFVTKLFHKILLDMDLSDIEVEDFQSYKSASMMVALLPRWLVSTFRWAIGLRTAQENRDLWLEKYDAAMKKDTRGIIPEMTEPRDRRFLADLLLTGMTSAGGLSVPTVMDLVLAVVYGGENSPLPENQRSLTKENIRPLVYETVRRFPVVVGYPWWSPDMSKRYVLNLALGLRDPRKWDKPEEFKLRSISEYHERHGSGHKIGLAWAEQGKGPNGLTPDSRGCPGQELSIVILEEFLKALMPMQNEWSVTEMPEGGVKITEGPSAASSAFTLSRAATGKPTIIDVPGQTEPTTDEEEAEAVAAQFGGLPGDLLPRPNPTSFQCPIECQECCKAVSSWSPVLQRQDTSAFKCIMPKASIPHFKIAGRKCTTAAARNADPELGKSKCDLTQAEQDRGLHNDLASCTYEPIVQTYDDFLGSTRKKDYCAVSYTGTFLGLHAIGAVIDSMFFTVNTTWYLGGVCQNKAKELFGAGLLDKQCKDTQVPHDKCEAHEQAGLCKKLADDENAGRTDAVSTAMWAGAVGALRVTHELPKPTGPLRMLPKFKIPGWSGRNVAFEMPAHDLQFDTQGGAYQCMMKKLQGYNVIDDELFSKTRNTYSRSLTGSCPASNRDVRFAYFDRFGVYAKPQHFIVPESEMQTDRTLEKLVFDSIGAHHVEPIQDGRAINLNPISVNGLPTAALPGSPGLLEALPSEVQRKARFIVRLEGLFDNVPVRKGMQGWGGNAFFDTNGKLMALQYRGETIIAGQEPAKWEAFKFIFRSSLVSTVTAFDHLVSTHILGSESLAVATVETLPAHHGLRRLLTPHTWGSLRINMQAATNLFAKNMLVHRASPYEAEAFEAEDGSDGMLWKMIPLLRYTKFIDVHDKYSQLRIKNDTPEIPFYEDGKLLYDALFEYVQSFVHTIYTGSTETSCSKELQKDERAAHFVRNFFESNSATPDFWPQHFRRADKSCKALIELLAEVVFMVTGWHRHVGTVMDFFADTRFVTTSWKEGETEARPKQSMMMMLLAATTNSDLPKLKDNLAEIYSHDKFFRGLFTNFHTSMQAVQSEVEKRNARRAESGHMEFHQMEPRYVEFGVEV